MIARAFFALAAFAALALPAAAQVAVKGDWVSLGDVAPVAGEAAEILLSPAPPPGQKLALDPVFVTGVAKKAGITIALPLDQPIWVTRAGTAPAPAAPQTASASAAPKTPAVTTASAQSGMVLVLAHDVQRGAIIQAGDLDWQAPTGSKPRGLPSDIAAVVGMAAKRNLRAGAMLYGTDIEAPNVIRKGEPVRIVYAAEGLTLTVDGLAQGDAAKGESVRVLNHYTKRSIDAVATGEGEAHIVQR